MSEFSTTAESVEKTPPQIFSKWKSEAAKAWILAVSTAPFAQANTIMGTLSGAWHSSDCCEQWKQLRVSSPECVFPNAVGVIE